ncbi:hypothetical protein FNQ90_06835 [Streptomyces alkaliphilus]|uniref:Alpha/beta hydrolase n=1 Tax=Streptomyces alkaliphilus TaxID=1472722 RepID=A0A7W3TBJ7_9ACTN|nr:hypothetical protein [Streptomyces alkaliphilus]MBB0243826.1 hypothetical protein [Streptomyces alkaliphilus]
MTPARGRDDHGFTPHSRAREVADLLPDGRLIEVPGAPHALNHSSPVEMARITRELLTRRSAVVSGRAAEERTNR